MNFLVQWYNSRLLLKIENKKTKVKSYYQTNEKTTRNIAKVSKKSFWRWKNFKKINYANNKNKSVADEEREGKKEYMRNYYYKRKKLFNHLINQCWSIRKF